MSTAHISMSVIDAINTRSSVREYSAAPVSGAEVDALLRAAVRAPTAMHGEPWVFVVIQDRALLRKIDEAVKSGVLAKALAVHMLPADYEVFHGAGTLIVIGARKTGPFVEGDCWLAAENLMLAATASGLGTCCIGSAVAALNDPALKKSIGLPADVRAVVPIVVGHPAGDGQPTSRRDPEIAAWLA
jgi:nitroreductase